MRVPLRVPICFIYAGLSLPLLRACRPESGSVGVGWGQEWGQRSKPAGLFTVVSSTVMSSDVAPILHRHGPVVLDRRSAHVLEHRLHRLDLGSL